MAKAGTQAIVNYCFCQEASSWRLGCEAAVYAADLTRAFEDVEELAALWFSDCSHGSEPGCAVRAAIAGKDPV